MLSMPAKITKRKWISIVSDMPFHSCFSGRIPKKNLKPGSNVAEFNANEENIYCSYSSVWNIYTTFELGVSQYVPLRNIVSVPVVILPPPSCPGSQADPRRTLRSRLYEKTCPGLKGHPPSRVIELKRAFIWEEKSDPFAQVNSARACCDCLNQRSRMLWLSRLDRVAQVGRGKVLIWRKSWSSRLGGWPSELYLR